MDGDGAPPAVIMHCFSGDADFARECLDRGYYLSFAGTVTFTNAPGLREAAAITPRRQAARRDRRAVPDARSAPRAPPNSPAQAAHTVRALAEARGDEVEALCVDMWANSEALYGPW